MSLEAVLICPSCKTQIPEIMAESFQETKYTCPSCSFVMLAAEKDCCIYCLYSNSLCPTKQNMRHGCAG